MLAKFRNSMFYMGVLIMSLTIFFEHLFHIETDITCFFKGVACGFQILGAIILIINNRR